MKPAIFGAKGTRLTNSEADFFGKVKPCGFILFKRNIDTPDQVRALVSEMKQAAGNSQALVLIDQEGGRVARLRPPHWREYPSGRQYGALWRIDPDLAGEAAFLGARLIADDLSVLGINVDCLPVLDVPVPGAHTVIGDRAYGQEPGIVMALGRAASQGLIEGGILPIIKHIPGHGRAMADSHHDLPLVNASRYQLDHHDFPPFKALNDIPLAMTAHVIFTALDPVNPATNSSVIIRDIIRGDMGFDGLLMCDDLSMKALGGDFASRRQQALEAGCDVVLHCNGDMDEMIPIADGLADFTPEGQARYARAFACLQPPSAFDRGQAEARLAELLALNA